MKHIRMIAAYGMTADERKVISSNDRMPWGSVTEDLEHFYSLIKDTIVVLGRRTADVIPKKIEGVALVIVLSTDRSYTPPHGYTAASSLEEAFRKAELCDEAEVVSVCGGQRVYEESLEHADSLELTIFDGIYEGDVFFPDYEHLFVEVTSTQGVGFRFVTFTRE